MRHFDREFRLWDFRVSHDQLLLRSAKTDTFPTNIDIAFVGVEYIELPTRIESPTICPPAEADVERAQLALGRNIPSDQIFVVEAGNSRYLVVAAAMKASENDLDFMESSLERF